jgi:hypothetical protein
VLCQIDAYRCGPCAQVSVANLRITEVPALLPGAMQTASLTTSVACGCLLLYIRLIASVIGAPLLHEPGFLGAHSSIWQPDTFWRRDAASGHRWTLSGMPAQVVTWTAAASQALDGQQLLKCAAVVLRSRACVLACASAPQLLVHYARRSSGCECDLRHAWCWAL